MKTLDQYISEALVKNHIDVIKYPYVDLGLPSGTLWATCNLGASSPEEYGEYYMWGSVKDNSDDDCSWKNYPFNDGYEGFDGDAWETNKDKIIDKNGNYLCHH